MAQNERKFHSMDKKTSFLAVACGAAVAVFTFCVGLELALLCRPAEADVTQAGRFQASYSVSTNVPSTAPYYVGDTGYTTSSRINGANPATNSVPANTTNGSIWATPLDIRQFKSFAIEFMCNQSSNQTASVAKFTNWIFLYASGDELRYNTNHPALVLGPFTPQPGSTNEYDITNVPPGIFDNVGYVFCGLGDQGTNTVTNVLVRAIVKPNPLN